MAAMNDHESRDIRRDLNRWSIYELAEDLVAFTDNGEATAFGVYEKLMQDLDDGAEALWVGSSDIEDVRGILGDDSPMLEYLDAE